MSFQGGNSPAPFFEVRTYLPKINPAYYTPLTII